MGVITKKNNPDSLSSERMDLSATTIGNHALFSGGSGNGVMGKSISDVVDAYNLSLTRTTIEPLTVGRRLLAATTIGNYALFGGGENDYGATPSNQVKYDTVDVYDTSLTRITPVTLSDGRHSLAATSIDDYAIFGGGNGSSSGLNVVDAFDTSLTRTILTNLTSGGYELAAASINNYAIFVGGYNPNNTQAYSRVNAYDSSLTKSQLTDMYQGQGLAATTIGDSYAIFAGGRTENTPSSYINSLNSSLTKMNTMYLDVARYGLAAASTNHYALFGGGCKIVNNTYTVVDNVDAIDTSLTRTVKEPLSEDRNELAAANIGNFILFGGGYCGSVSSNYRRATVDLYAETQYLLKQIIGVFMPIFD